MVSLRMIRTFFSLSEEQKRTAEDTRHKTAFIILNCFITCLLVLVDECKAVPCVGWITDDILIERYANDSKEVPPSNFRKCILALPLRVEDDHTFGPKNDICCIHLGCLADEVLQSGMTSVQWTR